MPTPNEIFTSALPPAVHAAASESMARRRSDYELQLARRIDWRFLLPDPHLRRVAYCGPERGTLPEALKHFSESFRIVSSAGVATFDLVVLRLCDAAVLENARALLVPGGFLYWEMKPIGWSASLPGHAAGGDRAIATASKRWSRTRRLFRGHVDALARWGFHEIQMHWQRPHFEACLEIIPMDDSFALDYAFSRPRSDFASRLKFASGRLLMQTGLLAHLTPCFSLIAHKSE